MKPERTKKKDTAGYPLLNKLDNHLGPADSASPLQW